MLCDAAVDLREPNKPDDDSYESRSAWETPAAANAARGPSVLGRFIRGKRNPVRPPNGFRSSATADRSMLRQRHQKTLAAMQKHVMRSQHTHRYLAPGLIPAGMGRHARSQTNTPSPSRVTMRLGHSFETTRNNAANGTIIPCTYDAALNCSACGKIFETLCCYLNCGVRCDWNHSRVILDLSKGDSEIRAAVA